MLNVETIAEHDAEVGSKEKPNLVWKETLIVQTLFVYRAIKSFQKRVREFISQIRYWPPKNLYLGKISFEVLKVKKSNAK